MKNRQLQTLFICNVLVFSTANGLLPLLPVYAIDLGATPTHAGWLMAFAYLALAVGTILTGRLMSRFSNPKRLFVASSMLCMIANVALGSVATVWQLAAAMALLWFCGGMVVALITVFTSAQTTVTNRGKVFGFMYLAMPLGALIGGTLIGRLVDWQGYTLMFNSLSGVWLSVSLLGLSLRFVQNSASDAPAVPTKHITSRSNVPFQALLVAVFLASVAVFVGRLGTSLSMQSLQFSAGAITMTSAVGALVVIPVVPLLGILSDRLGRQRVLSLCYGLGAVGVLMLGIAARSWHFGVAAACLSMATYTGGAIASALATDLLPPEGLSSGLPRLNAMTWTGGIIGFATTGYLMDVLSSELVFVTAAVLSVSAVVLLQWSDWYRATDKHNSTQSQTQHSS